MPAFAKEPFNVVPQPDNSGIAVVAGVPNEVKTGRIYFER
jgi:hypothetical protein